MSDEWPEIRSSKAKICRFIWCFFQEPFQASVLEKPEKIYGKIGGKDVTLEWKMFGIPFIFVKGCKDCTCACDRDICGKSVICFYPYLLNVYGCVHVGTLKCGISKAFFGKNLTLLS